MAGSFQKNIQIMTEKFNWHDEWNVRQDIQSARYVADFCPVERRYFPFECGWYVHTVMKYTENPIWYCMLEYAKSEKIPYEPEFLRPSWDPLVCLCGIGNMEEYFVLSDFCDVKVTEKGFTVCIEGKGNARYYIPTPKYREAATIVNKCVKKCTY